MRGLIEQAALRLEQLSRAGVGVDNAPAPAPALAPQKDLGVVGSTAPSASPTPPAAPPVARRVEIDRAALAAAGLLVPDAPRTALADQFRVIKRPLIRNARGRAAVQVTNGNLIMVTSALVGEGKTFTAVNLAMSLASEVDHTVMLVDADVERPSVARVLGLNHNGDTILEPGLLDVLDGQADLSDVILQTNIDKLTLVPSGVPRRDATELLASDTMTRLLADMTTRYQDRIIVFDSPPLLLTTEARVLATHMGQVVVVVHAEKTPQAKVESALALIDACPVRLLVLNHARDVGDTSYGYGYGYGYGAKGPSAATEAPPKKT